MLQYADLELRDISYYWGESTLLFERRGTFIPCRIGEIDAAADYPIRLVDSLSGDRLINLRLPSFISRILVHHPALGYADYSGIPIYISTKANRGRQKGVDHQNIRMLCPVDVQGKIIEAMQNVCRDGRAIIDGGQKDLPDAIRTEYRKLMELADKFGIRSGPVARRWGQIRTDENGRPQLEVRQPPLRRAGNVIEGEIRITNHNVRAKLLAQCVNDDYPAYRPAIKSLMSSKERIGTCLSKDFAVIKLEPLKNVPRLAVYHKMSHVGTIFPPNNDVVWNTTLSREGQDVLQIAMDKIRR
jgi:hypothetical protein